MRRGKPRERLERASLGGQWRQELRPVGRGQQGIEPRASLGEDGSGCVPVEQLRELVEDRGLAGGGLGGGGLGGGGGFEAACAEVSVSVRSPPRSLRRRTALLASRKLPRRFTTPSLRRARTVFPVCA